MSEYQELQDKLGAWQLTRLGLLQGIREGREWEQALSVVDEHIAELRDDLADLEWDVHEDFYAEMLKAWTVEPEPVDSWELLPTYEPSWVNKTRFPVAA